MNVWQKLDACNEALADAIVTCTEKGIDAYRSKASRRKKMSRKTMQVGIRVIAALLAFLLIFNSTGMETLAASLDYVDANTVSGNDSGNTDIDDGSDVGPIDDTDVVVPADPSDVDDSLVQDADDDKDGALDTEDVDKEDETVSGNDIELSTTVDGVEIILTAKTGVFPADATLKAESADASIKERTAEMMAEQTGDETVVDGLVLFDISVLDVDGNEVQPDIPDDMDKNTAVTVSFKRVVAVLQSQDLAGVEESSGVSEVKTIYVDDAVSNVQIISSETNGEDIQFHPDHFSLYGAVLNEMLGAATIENDGYPYGTSMDSSQITLNIDATNEDGSQDGMTYQWQVGDSESGEFTDIAGATNATYTFTPTNMKWYRCMVNGATESKAIQATKAGASGSIRFLNASECWYLSNGAMAYSAMSSSKFDIVGLYIHQGTKYWMNTSFNKNWQIQGSPSKTIMFFADTKVVGCKFVLASGSTQCSIGCDTMLANYSITSYCDSCSLKAIVKDNVLEKIQMVGAESLDVAQDTDPAFVFTPGTPCTSFWIGNYGSRTHYSYYYLEQSGNGYLVSPINGRNVVTEVQGIDSGATMSWTGVTSGVVEFAFSIGTVAETGAETSSTATSKTVTIVKPDVQNYYYALFEEDGTATGKKVAGWTNTPNEDGDIVFENLKPNTNYKVVSIAKSTYESNPDNPSLDNSTEEEIVTNVDPLNPKEDAGETFHPVITAKSTTIEITGLDKSQQYALQDASGSTVYDYAYPSDNSEAKLLYTNLNPGTKYYLVAKHETNNRSDKSEIITLYKVTFSPNGGSNAPAAVMNLSTGDKIAEPAGVPTRADYAFDGWYKEASCTNAWDFENDAVNTSNVTLYAKWIAHEHQWNFSQTNASTLIAYCSNADVTPRCAYFATDLASATTPAKVHITTPSVYFTGTTYSAISVSNTLSSTGNTVSGVTYYSDSNCTVPTTTGLSGASTSGGAPKNCGWYYAVVTVSAADGNTYTLKSSFQINEKQLSASNLILSKDNYTATGSEIYLSYAVKDGNRTLTKDVDYTIDETAVVSATDIGSYTIKIHGIGNYTGTVSKTWKVTDATAPTLTIGVDGMSSSSSFRSENYINFNSYFASDRTITIDSTDVETADDADLQVSYYVSASARSLSYIQSINDSTWKTLDNHESFTVNGNHQYVIYARAKDPSGNVTYASSNGFVIDKVAPVIRGVVDDGQYCNDTYFSIVESGSGIASVKIDGVEKISGRETRYKLTSVDSSTTHTVVVTDRAGNSATISGITLHVESEHEWKDDGITKEATCSEEGERKKSCSKCGAASYISINKIPHVFNYGDDDAWHTTWTLADDGVSYVAKSYINCDYGCGEKEEYTGTVTRTVEIEPTSDAPGVAKYEVTIPYVDENGTPQNKVLTKTVTLAKLDNVKTYGDSSTGSTNQISTGVAISEGAPRMAVSGMDADSAAASLPQADKADLEDTSNTTDTSIYMYLEIQTKAATVDAGEKDLLEQSLLAELELVDLGAKVYFLDISLYENKKDIQKDVDGNIVGQTEETKQITQYSKPLTMKINVDDLGFGPVPSGLDRVYSVSRIHDYSNNQDGSDVRAEIVFTGKAQGGVIDVASDKFCTFAVSYKDIPHVDDPADDPSVDPSTPTTPANPGDQGSITPGEQPAGGSPYTLTQTSNKTKKKASKYDVESINTESDVLLDGDDIANADQDTVADAGNDNTGAGDQDAITSTTDGDEIDGTAGQDQLEKKGVLNTLACMILWVILLVSLIGAGITVFMKSQGASLASIAIEGGVVLIADLCLSIYTMHMHDFVLTAIGTVLIIAVALVGELLSKKQAS